MNSKDHQSRYEAAKHASNRAEAMAKAMRATLEGDKAGRRRLYKKLGLPTDDSVK